MNKHPLAVKSARQSTVQGQVARQDCEHSQVACRMEKEDWKHTNKALIASDARLSADIKKQLDSLQLASLIDTSDAPQHRRALFAAVHDAKLHLKGLQRQIGEGQSTASSIQALATRISGFTELLNTLKASQRQQYALLLQQEQQLLEELQAVQISYNADPLQEEGHIQKGSTEQQPASVTWQDTDAVALHYRDDSPDKQHRQSQHSCRRAQLRGCAYPVTKAITPCRFSINASGDTSCTATQGHNCDLLPEVQAYDNFLAKHGQTGGWHPDDHNTFMTILRSSRGDYSAAVPAAADVLPVHTRQAVIAHCRWHADFTELDMRRRVALVNWRAAKDAAKSAMRAEAATLQDTSPELPHPADDQVEKEYRQIQKQQVEQWKQQKQQAAELQAQLDAVKHQQQKERQQRELQEKRAMLKQRMQELKDAKQQPAAAVTAETPTLQAHKASTCLSSEDSLKQQELQQRLQQRSFATLQRRQQLMAAKADKEAARDRVRQQLMAELETVKPRAERDPNRLLSATAAAAARAAAAADDAATGAAAHTGRGSILSGFVLHLGHKAVPAWASGMR